MCNLVLLPDSPALLGGKVAGENHENVMENEIVKSGNILELFNGSGRISDIWSQSLFYLRDIT